MTPAIIRPLLGLAIAVAITATMDGTGLGLFSALPLLLLAGLFWFLQKFSRREFGLIWGGGRDHVWAVAYPLVVVGSLAALAILTGRADLSTAVWPEVARDFLLMATTGILGTLLTEEGFFRGWLWASLRRALGRGPGVLLFSSVGFALWHISAVTLYDDFTPPAAQIPVYLLNVVVLGLNWGLLRQRSGSVLVPAVSHSVWNAMAYGLFGFGTKTGALGVTETAWWSPETGWLGLGANLVFMALLIRRPGPSRRPWRA